MVLLIVVGVWELRTSAFQSHALAALSSRLSYILTPGKSRHIVFPRGGPFDDQRGYARIPEFTRRLEARGYRIGEQSRFSPGLELMAGLGVPVPYSESPTAGLIIRDDRGQPLYDSGRRRPVFRRFEDIPRVVVSALLFMENRELGRPVARFSNPALDWKRLGKAALSYAARGLGLAAHLQGGSTLAVQIEKYRHSPGGQTDSPVEKLRQIAAASLNAYRQGPDTREVRREIILDYLNTIPLASAAAYGEVNGLAEGLRVWFGTSPAEIRELFSHPESSVEKARAFKKVLALLYAVRAPTNYLIRDRQSLESKVNSYTRLLEGAGIIDRELSREVQRAPIVFAQRPGSEPTAGAAASKATDLVRAELRDLLQARDNYALDRLDLEVQSTIDAALQDSVERRFRDLRDPEFLATHELCGEQLLSQGDPRRVVYSMMLVESMPEGDLLRVHADNSGQPFDVNRSARMELGSTAKLRTLAHYLEAVAYLHAERSAPSEVGSGAEGRPARDPISRWVTQTMRRSPGMSLDTLLDRALDRAYSASPNEVFFTGGGRHLFHNFDPDDNHRRLSVREATARSTNLVFVRLMRDLVRFHQARLPYNAAVVLADRDDPDRKRLLEAVAKDESRGSLESAYRMLRRPGTDGPLVRLLGPRAGSARCLAVLFYAWNPGANTTSLAEFLAANRGKVSNQELRLLGRAYGTRHLTLSDGAYLLRLPPLEIWCAGELIRHPEESWQDVVAHSEEARRESGAWLFRARNHRAQQIRLRIRIERDAFARMAPSWRRLGFPFPRLVPSYATAIGSSADRPAALAELMGVILNDGVRRPWSSIQGLCLGPDTPYHTGLAAPPPAETRVMAEPVARALKGVLAGVVEHGTARRIRGAFDATALRGVRVGGKTGSGDNRYETFARGGAMTSSRTVSRTSAFVFYVEPRYYGIVTAAVFGPEAKEYRFTSALPLEVLKSLAPAIGQRLAPDSTLTSVAKLRLPSVGRAAV